MLIKDFKVLLQVFLKLAFFPFIFRHIFRITISSNKVFNFSQVKIFACHISKIQLQLERNFIWPKTFLFHKHSVFYSEERLLLKITVPEFSITLKTTFSLLAIFLKITSIRKKSVVLFDQKLSIFYL